MAFTVRSPSAAPLGTAVYADNAVNVPAQFQPTITFTAKANGTGSNHNVSVKVVYPLAVQKDGIWSATNTFQALFSFTSLQNVINDAERVATLDALIKFLTDNKTVISKGVTR